MQKFKRLTITSESPITTTCELAKSPIAQAIILDDAIELANQYTQPVTLQMNGQKITINPEAKFDDVWNMWMKLSTS